MISITSSQAFSIFGVIDDLILNKDGSVSAVYKLDNPEMHSLDEIELDQRHENFVNALRNMPAGCYYHKQDIFLKKEYEPECFSNSFISVSERNYFKGRTYLNHLSIVSFTLTGLKFLETSHQSNPLSFKDHLRKEDLVRLNNFAEKINSVVSVINSSKFTRLTRIETKTISHIIFEHVNGFSSDGALKTIHFNEKYGIGNSKGSFFAISDENYLPEEMDSLVKDYSLTNNETIKIALMEDLGVLLPYNHVVNQIIYFPGHELLMSDLEHRMKVHGQYRNFSSKIKHAHKKLETYLDQVQGDPECVLVKTHFNVMVWDDHEETLKKAEKKINEIFSKRNIKFFIPQYDGLKDIFIGSIIGREKKMDYRFFFPSDLKSALGLSINHTSYKSDDEGIFFQDRLFQIPIKTDIWDEQKKRIPARNGMIIAGTGGGKSSTALNIIQQLLEQGVKVIVVEFGNSFEQLTKLYPGISAHISYKPDSPLGINPFDVSHIKTSAEEEWGSKLKTLTELILKYWRAGKLKTDANLTVALSKCLMDFYENVSHDHSFPSFYSYISEYHQDIFERKKIEEDYLDIKSFLHVCSQFMPGGIYENVCAPATDTEDKIRKNDLIVFEMTAIKKDPFLVSIIMTALFDTIESKILSDRSCRGVLIFDEYAETQGLVDIFSGEDIHSTVAFAYQKMRKENGAVYTIIQSPAQLPKNPNTDNIIANTQLLYVLPTTEIVYDEIISAFHMKSIHAAQINLMKSIKNDFSSEKPYSEVFIRFLDSTALVRRLEFSREKFYAFQTDGSTWKTLNEYYKESESMESAILKLIKEKNEEISFN